MAQYPVGIRSLALTIPSIRRTNDYYREKYPELIEQAEQKSLARLFSLAGSTPINEFDLEMIPYLADPFRGTVERYVLAEGESSLTLEYQAAKNALAAAKLLPDNIDLMLVASIWPEQVGFGNAAFLAGQLGLKGAAWNLDGACGVAPVALQTASALVRTGEYRNVLVVISCTYSQFFDEDDTVSWCMSDGAGAFVVSSLELNQGVLGTKTVHTSVFCDTLIPQLTQDKHGNPHLRMKVDKSANRLFREMSADLLRTCCEGAVAAAGITFEEVDFFLFNTATAWFANFCTRVLGINQERTINLYPQYANIGPVLTVVNMYYAAMLGKIRENDLVLIYGFGVTGVASASVMRWGKVALSPPPLNLIESDLALISSKDRNKAPSC